MNVAEKTHNYFRGAINEVKKVTWPTRKQTIQYSIVVVAMSLGIAIFFGGLDYIFSELLNILLNLR